MTGADEQFKDDRMGRLQARIARLEQLLSNAPFSQGIKLTLTLTTTATLVPHRLGRAPNGLLVLSTTPGAWVGFAATQPSDVAHFCNMTASTTTTAIVWLF